MYQKEVEPLLGGMHTTVLCDSMYLRTQTEKVNLAILKRDLTYCLIHYVNIEGVQWEVTGHTKHARTRPRVGTPGHGSTPHAENAPAG